MENLAAVDVDLAIPTKKYVDDKSMGGFSAYSGRWAPIWNASKASAQMALTDKWIYAYRFITNVAIQTVAIENPGPQVGMALRLVLYADAPPWPGAKLNEASVTTDAVGIRTAVMAIAKGTYWLALHNISGSTVPLRAVVERNPYSPGSVDTTGINSFKSGIAYNVASTTSPATWPAGTGSDVDAIMFAFRAT